MEIRTADRNDLEAIRQIFNYAVLHTTSLYDYEPYTVEQMENWFNGKTERNNPVLACETDGVLAGFATYDTFRNKEGYKFTAEHSVYVHQEFRRRGIGRKLLESIMDTARNREIHTLVAGIDAENTVSIELHRKMGFREAGLLKETGFKFGRWLDLVFLQHIFEQDL